MTIRKDLEKVNQQLQMNFGKSTKNLNQILGSQRPFHVKTKIGFDDQKEKVIEQYVKTTKASLDVTSSGSSKSERIMASDERKKHINGFIKV